jgi:peptidoglycan/xylan/chitin deacetylase (PgdA/CDA1 family)
VSINRRWLAKKVARHGMALGNLFSGSLAAQSALRTEPRVRVLTYHRFGKERDDAFIVESHVFEMQMRILAEERLAVSLAQVKRFVEGRETLPDGACLVTIDDGMMSTYTEAFPVLRRWGVPAVAYCTAGLIGSDLRYPERYMTPKELKELVRSGLFEIGSHAFSHRSLGMMPRDEAFHEAKASRERLEQDIEAPVTSFAYPFGTRGDFNPYTERALADAGYTIAFNSVHGAVTPGMDPISLPRVKVEGGEALWMFQLLRRGAMDSWRAVDYTMSRFQRVREEVVGEEIPTE